MSTWPVIYPDNVQDKGRLTTLFAVPVDDFAKFKETTLKEHSTSARQILQGRTIDDGNSGDALADSVLDTSSQKSGQSVIVLIDADPTNEASTLKGASPDGTTSYSFVAPSSYTTTPKAGYYLCNLMKVTKAQQPALAAALDAYLRGMFHCGAFEPVFHHNVVSREDPEMIINIQGWPTKEAGREYWTSRIHTNFFPAVVDLLSMAGSWEVELK